MKIEVVSKSLAIWLSSRIGPLNLLVDHHLSIFFHIFPYLPYFVTIWVQKKSHQTPCIPAEVSYVGA